MNGRSSTITTSEPVPPAFRAALLTDARPGRAPAPAGEHAWAEEMPQQPEKRHPELLVKFGMACGKSRDYIVRWRGREPHPAHNPRDGRLDLGTDRRFDTCRKPARASWWPWKASCRRCSPNTSPQWKKWVSPKTTWSSSTCTSRATWKHAPNRPRADASLTPTRPRFRSAR